MPRRRPETLESIMRRTYSVIAWIIAAGVVVQASSIAFGVAGMVVYVQDGGVVDKALVEARQQAFVGELGFMVHAIVGGGVIPLAAIALLIVSFFVKARGVRMWAAITFGLVALQATLGFAIHGTPYAGLVHGANALAVLSAAVYTALRMRRLQPAEALERTSDGITV